MEKKEFPKKLSPKISEGPQSKLSGISGRAFGIIKFILGICLLPFVYSLSVAFLKEFGLVGRSSQGFFWAGVVTFIIVHFFVYESEIIYSKGHRLLEIVFSFFSPLVKVAPYVLPIYTIIIFLVYLLLSLFFKSRVFFHFFLFIFSFSLALHLVFSAKTVRAKKNDFLKSNYIFGFSFIYIINLILVSLCLNLIFKEYSFVNFFNNAFNSAKGIFYAAIKQLFL